MSNTPSSSRPESISSFMIRTEGCADEKGQLQCRLFQDELYGIEETLEAGIMLQGSEVKSLRLGQSNIAESYAEAKDGEMFLVNAYIPEYNQASYLNHETRRPRKLLLRRREIAG